jgi:hypothetical protein
MPFRMLNHQISGYAEREIRDVAKAVEKNDDSDYPQKLMRKVQMVLSYYEEFYTDFMSMSRTIRCLKTLL